MDTKFNRPKKGIHGWASRPLGPLPRDAELVNPTEEELAALPSFTLLAISTLAGAVALLLAFAFFAPWLVVSPTSLMWKVLVPLLGGPMGWTATIMLTMFLMSALSAGNILPRYKNSRFLDKAAAYEEQWFRMGAESWSLRQRTYSCASFGFVHITNVFYPITSLIVVALVGGVFMAVYLKHYRATGSATYAVLASTKLHATYNRFAVVYMVVALVSVAIGMWLT